MIVYTMEEFDSIMDSATPWEIARACFYGHEFCPANEYFRFNGYANLESFDYAPGGNSGIFISDIARYMDENEESFELDEVEELFEEEDFE